MDSFICMNQGHFPVSKHDTNFGDFAFKFDSGITEKRAT